MKRFFVFLFMLLATFSLASAQTIDIKGTVIDENGEPVIGASVMSVFTLFWTGLTFLLASPPYAYSTSQIGLVSLLGEQSVGS